MAVLLRLSSRRTLQNGGNIHQNIYFRSSGISQAWSRAIMTTSAAGRTKLQKDEDFWEKNKRMNRPMSPHLTIYKPQLTSLLSITHRMTGFTMSGIISTFGIGMMLLPESFPTYLEYVQNLHLGSIIIFGAKFTLAVPFTFHIANGVRHLIWDAGYGFDLRTLYNSGYAVLGFTILMSFGLAML